MTTNPIDPTVPHNARVWNYWLGGKDNYAADRAFADRMAELLPVMPQLAKADRAFLRRAMRYLTDEAGIRQFIDVGTGLPTEGNTHELAQRIAPESRVVYVDNDPLVLAHAEALLTSGPHGATAYLHQDAREPEGILTGARETLDFGRPVAVLGLSVLHFLDDAEVKTTVRTLMDAVPSGSFLAVAHATTEYADPHDLRGLQHWNTHSPTPIHLRSREDLTALLLEGLELLEPGIVSCGRWRADDIWRDAPEVPQFGLVARKP
ncbi:SAM-dependent methyltransferase [Streptomyces sp. NPDC051940]|uniref:SAM-dependent methyltransferase n=1 Tax=Streptomyces sp. NPDC051940 TaxID=3155675 RepID=UPI00342B0DF9